MAPLIVLFVTTLAARMLGLLGVDYVESWSAATAVGLAAMFVLTGLSHFTPPRRAGLIAIIPPGLPKPAFLVSVTGLLELVGAAGLLVPPSHGSYRTAAAWGLALLLITMFPANVYAARAQRSPSSPSTPLGRRSLMQGIYLAAALVVAFCS